MKKYLYLLTVIVTFSACHRNDFTVTGNVSDAEGKTLYFEATQIDKIVTLDSIKLKSDGKFTFYAPKTEFPEFYRLRLDSSYIHFAIDSTETVTFQTSGKSFTDYSVEGSEENKQIQEVSKAGSLLKNEVDKILSNTETSDSIRIANAKRLLNALDQYKKTTLPIIYGNPKSKAAYFAIFQQVNGNIIFDPFDKEDSKAIRAVANAYDVYYKGSHRAKQLYNMAIASLQAERQLKQPTLLEQAKEASLIDISLPDIKGKQQKLSDLKGKVVLLDFTAYQTDYSPEYNILLAKIYKQFKDKGLEIYQVSLDNDENFWKVSASNLPWICVRDEASIYSTVANLYNVKNLPSAFLIDRTGAIQKRIASIESISGEIQKLL